MEGLLSAERLSQFYSNFYPLLQPDEELGGGFKEAVFGVVVSSGVLKVMKLYDCGHQK